MVRSGLPLLDDVAEGGPHKAAQAGKDVDGRVDAFPEEFATEEDLALGDVAGQVGDGGGDVVARHREDGDLGDAAPLALNAAGALVVGGEVGVEVAGEALPPRDSLSGGRDFAKRFRVRGDVGDDDEDVHPQLEREVLGGGEGDAGGDYPLDGGVVREVEVEDAPADCAGLLQSLLEERGLSVRDADGRKDDRELLPLPDDSCLPGDLGGEHVVRHPRAGEDGELLPPDEGEHAIDYRDASLDEVGREFSAFGVYGGAIDVEEALADGVGQAVERAAEAVEDSAQKLVGDGELHRPPQEFRARAANREAGRAFEDLDDRFPETGFKDAGEPSPSPGFLYLDELIVSRPFDAVHDEQGTLDFGHLAVLEAALRFAHSAIFSSCSCLTLERAANSRNLSA